MSERIKKPVRKVRSNRVSVTLWEHQKCGKDGKKFEYQRACIQHSRKGRDATEWQNQQIWMNADELRDLAEALDQLNTEGEKSPSSVRAHCIVEYIKANSIDAGLEVFDLQERSLPEVLREYGIRGKLTHDEKMIIRHDLKGMIEQREFAEMARMVHNGNVDIGHVAGFHTS